MNGVGALLFIALLVSSLYLLCSSRLNALIRTVGFQGLLLGLVPFVMHDTLGGVHSWILGGSGILIKGILIPWLLLRALRGVVTVREIEPYLGFTFSTAIGIVIAVFSFVVHQWIRSSSLFSSPLVPVAFCMALCGLFLIVARKKALTQVVGYLVFENGIYLFGVSIAVNSPLLVELGILLDALVAVFVMGIVIHHINREFETISTQQLDALRD